MKLQKLIIKNLASIEEATIDFTSRPLSEAGIFLIAGVTGAGKSTILDAITLALYNNTPRLDGTSMQGKTKEVSIKDPRQMLRHGAGECSVTLHFEGNEGEKYIADWSVARARRNPAGKLQAKNWMLTRLHSSGRSDERFTKDTEIKAQITTAVGLSFEQFCRTTMLAQGQFTRFLNSNDSDKAVILEKITGVQRYRDIGRMVFQIASEKEQALRDAQQKMGLETVLTNEQIAKLEEDKQQLTQQLKTDRELLKETRDKHDWLKRDAELTKKQNTVGQRLVKAEAAVQEEQNVTMARTVSGWRETVSVRSQIATREENRKALTAIADDLTELDARATAANRRLAEAQLLKTKLSDEIAPLTRRRDDAPRKELYTRCEAIVTQIDTFLTNDRHITESNTEAAALDGKIKGALTDALNATKKAETEHAATIEKAQLERDEMQTTRDALNPAQLLADHSRAVEQSRDAETAIAKVTARNDAMAAQQEAKKAVDEAETKVAQTGKAITDANEEIRIAEDNYTLTKGLYDRQRESISDFCSHLRGELKVGDNCPVCNRKITQTLPAEDEIMALFRPVEEAFNNASDRLNKLKVNKASLQETLKVQRENRDELSRTLARREKDAIEAAEALAVALKKVGVPDDENVIATLKAFKEEHDARVKTLKEKQKEVNEADKKIRTHDALLRKLQKQLEQLRATTTAANEYLNKAKSSLVALRSKTEVYTRGRDTASDVLRRLLPEDEYDVCIANAKSFKETLRDETDAYTILVEKLQRLDQQKSALENSIEMVERLRDDAVVSREAWAQTPEIESIPEGYTAKIDPAEWSKLATELTVLATRRTAAEGRIADATAAIAEYLDSEGALPMERLSELSTISQRQIEAYEEQLQALHNEVLMAKSALETLLEQYEALQKSRPKFAEGDTIDTLNAAIEVITMQSEQTSLKIGEIEMQLRNDRDARTRLQAQMKEVERCTAECNRWKRLNELIGSATGDKFTRIAQGYVLECLVHVANQYMLTLAPRYTLSVEPGSFLIYVSDAYMAGVRRSAATISGGESFLVSLALALGLSDIGEKLNVDILFVDEGFGSLSGEALNSAINTLYNLNRHAGRQVGIISHVETLRERIPVQIRLKANPNTGSSAVEIVS